MYTIYEINTLPDLSKGLTDCTLYEEIPDYYYSGTGRSMILLSVPDSQNINAYDIEIISLVSSNGDETVINRNAFEFYHDDMILFHGTTPESAETLSLNGWEPNSGFRGNQFGNPKYLYTTNIYENALWFAQEKDSQYQDVLKIKVPFKNTIVDPEDGSGENIFQEYFNSIAYGLPSYLAVTNPIPSHNIKICSDEHKPRKSQTLSF